MRRINYRTICSVLLLFILMLACGGAGSVATEAPTTVTGTEESTPPTEVSIQHNDIPVNLPADQSGESGDFDSSKVLSNGSLVGGDRFTFGRFERPFNANTMDIYFSDLDIVGTQVFQDDIWIYANIVLRELTATSSANQRYAVEIDSNVNGKGDWLILSLKPATTDWAVTGVQVFQDSNADVGLELPTLTDEGAIGISDGFETKVFDQGQGNDPDTAWVRISPNNPNVIEFAIKKSVIGTPQRYLVGVWAGTALLDPSLFDLNDSFTHEQAGASDAGLTNFYPIKQVAEIDNSCRIAVGFQPTGQEPGLCETFTPQVDSPSGCQATVQQILACNLNPYGTWNAGTCSCDLVIPG